MVKKRDDDEEDGQALWRYVIKDVKPLARRTVAFSQGSPSRPRKRAAPQYAPAPATPPGGDKGVFPGIDRRTDEKLRRGQIPVDGRIDLHGMGQGEACEALNRFLLSGYSRGMRCVLVITGKGKDGKGVLRARVPEWLREGAMAGIVLRFYPARPQHGGHGAFYVLLRRKRD